MQSFGYRLGVLNRMFQGVTRNSNSTTQSHSRSQTSQRKRMSQKLHVLLVGVCVVIICIGQYRKAIRTIESSSFYKEDESFHPPRKQQEHQHQHQHEHEHRDHIGYNNDDDYPPPREINVNINPTSSKDKHTPMQRLQQQQQALITSQRMRSIQQFKNSQGFGSALQLQHQQPMATATTTTTHHKQPHYDIVNGKKTLVYHRTYPRVLYFVHIHKSAGTLICHFAYKNRLSAEHMSNCNVQEDQHCCGGQDTVQAQILFANTTYYDIVATEREMYDSMAPDHYDYIACIRDSKARYYSHWGHLRRLIPEGPLRKRTGGYGTAAWIMNDTSAAWDALPLKQQQQQQQQRRSTTFASLLFEKMTRTTTEDPLGDFETWYGNQPDNWNTRVFCGPKCMSKAKYQIPRDLFRYVLDRLDNFRHFIFVENITHSINQMADAYGWQLKHKETETKNRRKDHESALQKLQEQSWDFKMSALDDAIYEFAQRKYKNATKEQLWRNFSNQGDLDRYFEEGPSNGCTNACCGKCSLY
jgi:hypothetical protein